MTTKLKVLLLFSHAVVLFVGFGIGIYLSIYAQEGVKMTSQGAMISHYGVLVDIQRNEGNRDAYRKSLLAYLGILNDIINHPSKFFDVKTTSTDKMLVYERLSRLEREDDNLESADKYMDLAVETCAGTGWRDCSRYKITKVSQKIEENGMVLPKNKEGKTP